MPQAASFKLSNGTIVTAKEVASQLMCSITTARNRLKSSSDPVVIYEKVLLPRDNPQNGITYTLSNGQRGSVRELAKLAGVRENTLRQRLKVSLDYDYVMKKSVFENLDAKIYIFEDGTEHTVESFAKLRDCSHVSAYDLLESLNLDTRKHRTKYKLTNGREYTAKEIANKTGLSLSAVKKRLAKSKDHKVVLAPHRIRAEQVISVTKMGSDEHGLVTEHEMVKRKEYGLAN